MTSLMDVLAVIGVFIISSAVMNAIFESLEDWWRWREIDKLMRRYW